MCYQSTNVCRVCTDTGVAFLKVIPYCIFNVLSMLGVYYIEQTTAYTISISNVGHSLISMVVSFLLVARINGSLGRYNEAQNHLTKMYRQSRDLTQKMIIISQKQNLIILSRVGRNTAAQEWRNEVAHRTMLVLRTAVACMVYPTSKVPSWNVPELYLPMGASATYATSAANVTAPTTTNSASAADTATTNRTTTALGNPGTRLLRRAISSNELKFIKNGLHHKIRRWAHGYIQEDDFLDTLRVPNRCAYLLRESIISHNERLPNPLPVQNEIQLLNCVDSILEGWYG